MRRHLERGKQVKERSIDKITALAPNFSISKAHRAQKYLSEKIVTEDRLPREIRLIAGIDVAYDGDIAIGAVAILDYKSRKLMESQTAVCRAKVPYVPTLLAFRELPVATACMRKMTLRPDVFLADGQGIAHPYNCGFASHIGLAIGKPTIGVAKSKLIGKPIEIEDGVFLIHESKVVGSVIKTVKYAKPVYVSVGHLISLKTAVEIVKNSTYTGRIPEPLRQAHRIASERRQQLKEKPDLRKT